MADPADSKEYARPRAEAAGVHWPTYEKLVQQESGWSHWSSPGVVKSSPTGSMGLGQLNSRFYPESDWRDPYTNLTKSISILASYLQRFGTYRKALASYNWGPGNVGGYTKPDGTVVPPWDGRRETISDQGRHYLDVILGSSWEEPGAAPSPPSGVVYEDYRDPGHALFAKQPKGVVLHGSRSGVASNPIDKEYVGTANWELNNPNGYAWHATIGNNKVALHLTPKEWGQHDPWASQEYMGVEFAQPTVNNPITDAQVAAFADWFKTRVLPVWPSIPRHFPSHPEVDLEYGQNQGKSDAFPVGDVRMDQLRARIMTALGQGAPPVEQYSVGDGIRAKMAEYGDAPASDELFFKKDNKDEWSEAYGQTGSRYLYIVSLNRVFRYQPAA